MLMIYRYILCICCHHQDSALTYLLDNGMNRDDIVIGISAYGRSYELASSNYNALGDEIIGDGPINVNLGGPDGVIPYYEVSLL